MVDTHSPEAVLITGVFGAGKSSVAVEIADVLEKRDAPYAVLDLDFLAWFHTGTEGEGTVHAMMLRNLSAVARNYLNAGVRFFILAGAIRDRSELDELGAVLSMRLQVVRLTLPLERIRERLRSDVTAGRQDDLREAADWVTQNTGVGIEDLTIANDGPIRQVAQDIVDWLGWP
jgi:hypothetical protein